jgi:hypothetical protein
MDSQHRQNPHSGAESAAHQALPTLELPPVPFARSAATVPPVAAVTPSEMMPSGSSIDDILDALRTEPAPSLDATDLLGAAGIQPPQPVYEERPHEEFSAAVDRRNRRERRRNRRETPDRRAFTSTHMAAPMTGPADPRPTAPPPVLPITSPAPIDARMPELPIQELQPAMPYELPSRGVAAETIRSTRPSANPNPMPAAMPQALTAQPLAGQPFPAASPAPPMSAPEPPTAPVAPIAMPVEQDTSASFGIEGIFDAFPQQVGRLETFAPPAAPAITIPDAGPAGPAMAPGAGLDPAVATAAATPAAWFGGQVQVDEAMLVWNAPGATAPLGPSVAAAIAPQPTAPMTAPSAAAPAPAAVPAVPAAAASIATTTLAPGAAAAAGSTAAATAAAAAAATGTAARSPLARLLRLLAWIGIPAGAGIGLAVALDHLLF